MVIEVMLDLSSKVFLLGFTYGLTLVLHIHQKWSKPSAFLFLRIFAAVNASISLRFKPHWSHTINSAHKCSAAAVTTKRMFTALTSFECQM